MRLPTCWYVCCSKGWVVDKAAKPHPAISWTFFSTDNPMGRLEGRSCSSLAAVRGSAAIVAAAAGLDRQRLLQWILSYARLGAAWRLQSGHDAAPGLAIAAAGLAERSDSIG